MSATEAAFADAALTEDRLLGGRVRLLQPKTGYRAAVDPVLLAAACPAKPGDRVLDVGCGAGAAALCLAARVGRVDLEGLEAQPAYAALARRNGFLNGVAFLAHGGDVRRPPLSVRASEYDQVITNPPYDRADTGAPAADAGRDAAHRESATLGEWLDLCLRRLRPKGALTVIQRIDRLDGLLAALVGRAGSIQLCPVWPRAGAPAKRILLRAVKGGAAPLSLAPGFTLHDGPPGLDAAPFTPEAEAVLREAAALDF